MSSFQKAVKYGAIAFAIFLIVTIFSGILMAGYSIVNSVGLVSSEAKSELDHAKYESYLDINLKYSNLKIVKGNALKVENSNDKVLVEQDNNNLIITDKSSIFSKNKDSELLITVPSDMKYDIVSINSGAGKITIEGFDTKKLDLNLGAGQSNIFGIVSDDTEIDSGTGDVSISDCKLNNTKLDLGVGNISINADITGNSSINCGIGNISMNLYRSASEYKFDIDKGIGKISLNNGEVYDDGNIGSGSNYIDINGGIGNIDIHTR